MLTPQHARAQVRDARQDLQVEAGYDHVTSVRRHPCARVHESQPTSCVLLSLFALTFSSSPPLRRSALHVSYGGLLMRLRGEASRLSKLRLDDRVYLLLRKVS